VRVGKRFADNFYAAYERSLSGAMGTLFVFYDVSRLLTVRAEAGERTGVDLIFTFSFDGWGRKK
jgi:translocation and assembly module TamB